MGFWSTLGTIGGIAAAPFTGGASMIPTLAAIGGTAGGLADKLSNNDQPQAAPKAPSAQEHGAGGKTAEALAMLGGLLAGRAMQNHAEANAIPPQVQQMMDIGVQRQAYQNPLFQAVNQGAYQMLPGFARAGTDLSGSLPNQIPAAQAQASSDSGGINPALLAALIGGGVGLGGLLTGTNPYGKVLDGLKHLFGHGGTAGAPSDPNAFVGPQQPTDKFEGPLPPQWQNGQWTPSGSDFQTDEGYWPMDRGNPMSNADIFGS
jgi:hypothetical protein